MDNKEKFTETLNNIFASLLLDSEINCTQQIKDYLSLVTKEDLDDPDIVYLYFTSKMENCLQNYAASLGLAGPKNYVFALYGFIDNHLSSFCEQTMGSGCSSDRARYLISSYLNNKEILTGQKFYHPRFGDHAQWVAFIESLVDLYYGKPEKFLKSTHDLQKAYALVRKRFSSEYDEYEENN
ncbi:MAG: hypothetical protein V4629_03370 [Pseudomonadota bacterium]